ncbi:MAG TPA: tRNA lysidine(34) synthetase TilS [Steroidobacteraceae bacterium]|nr:tRNA lysidine(34) synthetase TilS [Steroidobacteraceae bacterium]
MSLGAERVAASLDAIDRNWRAGGACVALSGGLDSSVLLHLMAALAQAGDFRLRALHVDHGLQSGSAGWAEACRSSCALLHVPLRVLTLGLVPARGESVEAVAREARRLALAAALEPDERLLTAQHRDDQLETVLIQLLRGAGVTGLAAMPARTGFGPGWQLRPLLDVDRAEIRAYAAQHGIAWHDDPMNADARFDRGWLRARVLPAIRERWPAAAATVSRSAAHLAEASRLLDAVAAADAVNLLDDGRVSLAGLAGLARDRQVNLLRWWVRQSGLRPPPASQLGAALPGFFTARPDAAPRLSWPDGDMRRYRGRLYAIPRLQEPGSFKLIDTLEGGLRRPSASPIEVRFRTGGESLKPHPGRPRKRLKDLCQEAGIVPWMREQLPLVFVGGKLAAVGDLWIDADFAVPPGEPALRPVWSGRPRIY